MVIRTVEKNDIIELCKDTFDFVPPDLSECIIRASVDDIHGLVAVGGIRLVGELSIMHHGNHSNISKAAATKTLFNEAIIKSNKLGLKLLYGFTKDDKLSNIAKLHFGFREINHAHKIFLEI